MSEEYKEEYLEYGKDLFFRQIESFSGHSVPERDRKTWQSMLSLRMLPKKSVILRVGDIPTEYYFVIKGLVRQYYLDSNGADITRGFAWEGEFCCTEVLIQGNESLYTVETLEDCRLLAFRIADLNLLSDSAYMKDVYIAALEQNIRRRLNRDAAFLMNDAAGRYKYFIGNNPQLNGRIKQAYLSSYLGMTPESLSRIKTALKEGEK